MIAIRSFLFNLAFYAVFIAEMIIFTIPYFLAPRKTALWVPKFWAKSNRWLHAKIAGTTFEIEGLENMPEGPCIIVPKHQSFWDTFSFLPFIDDPVYILKRELMWIPLFGWYVAKQSMIPIDRGARGKVMAEMSKRTRHELAKQRQLIIYPEGTRRPPGAEPEYKYGVARIYSELNVPVVPIVHHAGLFWPRRKSIRQPGHFKVRILPPIQPGMEPMEFFKNLVDTIETASDKLLVETIDANPHLKLVDTAKKRYAELTGKAL